MEKIAILQKFQTNVIRFFDDLHGILPQVGDFVIIRLYLENNVSAEDMMQIFSANLNKNGGKLREVAKQRNDTFFLNNDPFGLAGKYKESAKTYKDIWKSDHLDEDERKMIWRYIDAFIKLSDSYTQLTRSN